MTNYKIKLFAILMLPLAVQSAGITDWNQQLLDAAESSGNIDQVKEALNHGANVNFVNPDDHEKCTVLHIAARRGHTEIVNKLIKSKATIDAKDNYQWTPLYWAATQGHIEVVDALILAKADVFIAKDKDQWTSLHWAARNGKTRVVNALILAKATIDARSNEQYTPLHLAAENGRTDVINALLDVGANARLLNKDYQTIFDLISQSWIKQIQKEQIIKLIKDHQKNQALMLAEVPKYFAAQQNKLNIPLPIAKLITQYAFGICESEEINNNKEGDKQ